MIIFLYGPDSYRRRQKLKEIAAKYEKNHQSAGFFDFRIKDRDTDQEFGRLREFCASHSLFENVKFAIVENILTDFAKSDNKNAQKSVIDFLKSNFENKDLTILISEEKSPLKIFDFLFKKPVLFQEFKNLEADKFEFLIKKEAEKRGLKLTVDAIKFIADIFGENTWGLINELEKLSLFNDKNFNGSRLKEIVGGEKPVIFSDFFRQIKDFAFGRLFSQRIINLEILFSREEPAKIFNFLASLSSNPSDLTKKFADYDIAIKSGKMDYEEALLDYAIQNTL